MINTSLSMEEILEKYCKEDSRFEPLLRIYNFNKPLIASKLSHISRFYFQYSNHNESHTRAIISSVEKFLGKEVLEYLSITDIYIFLLSAYLHDYSMSLSHKDILELVKSDKFDLFLTKNKDNEDFKSDIQLIKREIDKNQQIVITKKDICDNSWILESDHSLKRLIAEYNRCEHSSNSAKIILNRFTDDEININPGNIIPDRIEQLIAEICSFHGDDIKNIEERFEAVSNGIFGDEIHPRLLAFLIRIGDLLDVDSNRFDEDLLKSMPSLNSDSKVHYDKHHSITQLLISPTSIVIKAQCDYEEVVRSVYSWCKWIEKELDFFRSNIGLFIPKDWIIRIPNFTSNITRKGVKSEYSNNNLSISITDEKAFDIITGNTIYHTKFAFLREYLQNAIDASKVKLWNQIMDDFDFTDNYSQDVQEIHKKLYNGSYKHLREKLNITVHIFDGRDVKDSVIQEINKVYKTKDNDKSPIVDAYNNGKLIIVFEDNGVGISEEVIKKRILSPGAHDKTYDTSKENNPPALLRSTGSFGIGIHSAFMVSDKVYFQTKCTGETSLREIVIYSNKNNGWVEVININTDDSKIKSPYNTGTKCFMVIDPEILKSDIDFETINLNTSDNYDILISQLQSELNDFNRCDLFDLSVKIHSMEVIGNG